MSYFYNLDKSIIITNNLKAFCYDHECRLDQVVDILFEKYNVHAQLDYTKGYPEVEIFGGPTVSERDGLQAAQIALEPVIAYGEADEYILRDENGDGRIVRKH